MRKSRNGRWIPVIPVLLAVVACSTGSGPEGRNMSKPAIEPMPEGTEAAVFGGGCFWCLEACFERVEGVVSVISGYAGGHADDPDYEEVCSGTTGHAEVCRIVYDPSRVTYDRLLEVFFATHDPTSLNRQGNDVGSQYRSIILTTSDEQAAQARKFLAKMADVYRDPIVTEVKPLSHFWPAEDYHQDYFAKNPHQGYCQIVVAPKVEKFEKEFKGSLKPGR